METAWFRYREFHASIFGNWVTKFDSGAGRDRLPEIPCDQPEFCQDQGGRRCDQMAALKRPTHDPYADCQPSGLCIKSRDVKRPLIKMENGPYAPSGPEGSGS